MAIYNLGFAKPDDDESKDALDQLQALMSKPTGDLPVMKFDPMDIAGKAPSQDLPTMRSPPLAITAKASAAPPLPTSTSVREPGDNQAVPAAPPPTYGQSSGPLGMASQMLTGSLPQGYDMAGLEQAQNQARTDRIKALMLRAAGTIGNAIGQPVGRNVQRLPLDTRGYDQLEANADQPLQFEAQKNQRIQELLNRANQLRQANLETRKVDIEGQKANTEAQRAQQLGNYQQAEIEARLKALELGRYGHATDPITGQLFSQDLRTGRMTPATQGHGGGTGDDGPALKSKDLADRWEKFRMGISTVQGRGNLNRENQQALQRAEALEKLVLGPNGDIQNLNPQQLREAATALQGLISRGGPSAVSQIEELVPHTSAQKFANWKQYLLNEPTGANAQAFLQNMLDTAKREKGLIQQQIQRGQLQSVPEFMDLRDSKTHGDRKKFEALLQAAGIDPASIDERGLAKVGAGQGDGATVTVRRKSDGKTKTLPAGSAAKYLNDPAFERVQ